MKLKRNVKLALVWTLGLYLSLGIMFCMARSWVCPVDWQANLSHDLGMVFNLGK